MCLANPKNFFIFNRLCCLLGYQGGIKCGSYAAFKRFSKSLLFDGIAKIAPLMVLSDS